jgi:hypothetical protein
LCLSEAALRPREGDDYKLHSIFGLVAYGDTCSIYLGKKNKKMVGALERLYRKIIKYLEPREVGARRRETTERPMYQSICIPAPLRALLWVKLSNAMNDTLFSS